MDTLTLKLLSISRPFPLFFILYLSAYFILFSGVGPGSSGLKLPAVSYPWLTALQQYSWPVEPSSSIRAWIFTPATLRSKTSCSLSIAYFYIDLLHFLLFEPSAFLFIAHHLISLFGFLTCRYVVYHGALAVLGLLILAEVTSSCQNVWALASMRRSDVELAGEVFDLVSPPLYALYSIIRGLFDLIVYRMWAFYGTGVADDVMPQWVWISWVSLAVVMIFFSIFRISILWVE
ncbi:TLC domain-containing protein [Sesamum angolense]|uniref:TLC domain-containing protein n=1 Tax=Sesamum angolense TaxID=2727404 RepID=A0AAE1XEK2_9LAMI|nr:TLC domain-containing protein [Sesamum angolense]